MTKSQKIKLGVFTCLFSLLIGWLISIYKIVSNPTAIALIFAMIFLILINSFVIKEKKTKTWIWFSIVLLFFIMFHYSGGSKNDPENQEAIVRIEPENDTPTFREKVDRAKKRIEANLATKQAYRELGLSQKKSIPTTSQRRVVGTLPRKSNWGLGTIRSTSSLSSMKNSAQFARTEARKAMLRCQKFIPRANRGNQVKIE